MMTRDRRVRPTRRLREEPGSVQTSASDWLGFHVFYYDFPEVERLLLDAVRPLVRRLGDEGALEGWFFIRYFDGGPHVRLRLKTPRNQAVETAARVRDDLEAYLAVRPSGPGRWPDPSLWTEPNNSVAEVAYEPETARYGGASALGLAEAHFQDSSELALEVVARIRSSADPRSLRLAYSLQLTAMLAFSAGIQRELIGDYFIGHLAHVLGSDGPNAQYAEYYAANAETFVRKLGSLAAYYAGGAATTDPLVVLWRRSTEETFRRLEAVLTCPGSEFPESHPRLGLNSKYVLVLQSHIHMLLNRLGYWGDTEELVLRILRDAFRDPRLAGRSRPRAAMAVHA